MKDKLHERLKSFRGDERGSFWTLDAIVFAAMLIAGLIIAAQAAPTQQPQRLAADMAETQLQADAADLLAVANSTGDLRDATVYWNDDMSQFVDSGGDGYYLKPPDGHPLEVPLEEVLQRSNIVYNVDVVYQTPSGTTETERMFYQGTPGAHAVTASYTVVLYDDTSLVGPNSGKTLSEADNFYAPDAFPGGRKYNIVRVRMILWKI
ncbi:MULTISPECIES: hypothetical protein [unclassified Haloferax]|jgi:hypothetical protein|uniref:DUF7288 family protein n=1 Tax=unclassified Haloferax TaxID=2625095 RepID=UPI00287612B1|nr:MULTISPECIES: hypothetical protein [unclassified Haloferax]MDS0243146.1 hypothetical protein [Haloferax sp. S2CR25]MDS0446267.1 hypothetical protein [Haloferax sp. S2CR25-2]